MAAFHSMRILIHMGHRGCIEHLTLDEASFHSDDILCNLASQTELGQAKDAIPVTPEPRRRLYSENRLSKMDLRAPRSRRVSLLCPFHHARVLS